MPITIDELNIYDPYDAYISRFGGNSFKYDQLHNKLSGLPDKLFDFLFDLKTAEFLKARIVAPINLNEEQSKELAIMVIELILNEFYLGNVVNEVKNRVGVDEQKAKTIAGLIVVELFAPILEDLKRMHTEKFAGITPGPASKPQESKTMPPKPENENNESIIDLRNVL